MRVEFHLHLPSGVTEDCIPVQCNEPIGKSGAPSNLSVRK